MHEWDSHVHLIHDDHQLGVVASCIWIHLDYIVVDLLELVQAELLHLYLQLSYLLLSGLACLHLILALPELGLAPDLLVA